MVYINLDMNQKIICFFKNHLLKKKSPITTCLYYLIFKSHLWELSGLINTGISSKWKTFSQELSRFFSLTQVDCQFLQNIQKVDTDHSRGGYILEGRLWAGILRLGAATCHAILCESWHSAAQGKTLEGETGLKPEKLCLFPHCLMWGKKKRSTKVRKMFTNGPVTVMSSSPFLIYACKNK